MAITTVHKECIKIQAVNLQLKDKITGAYFAWDNVYNEIGEYFYRKLYITTC